MADNPGRHASQRSRSELQSATGRFATVCDAVVEEERVVDGRIRAVEAGASARELQVRWMDGWSRGAAHTCMNPGLNPSYTEPVCMLCPAALDSPYRNLFIPRCLEPRCAVRLHCPHSLARAHLTLARRRRCRLRALRMPYCLNSRIASAEECGASADTSNLELHCLTRFISKARHGLVVEQGHSEHSAAKHLACILAMPCCRRTRTSKHTTTLNVFKS